ncbi:MAG: hypothetical protein ACRERD_03375 [Candidatus Binatia bacterium]
MTFLLYLTGLLLIGVIAAFVASPLLRPEPDREEPLAEPEDEAARWEKQKADAYAAVKEAEFDRQMGKLTDEDYQVLREKYEARALEALARLDQLSSEQKRETGVRPVSANEA